MSNDTEILVILERMEGKLDRMRDRVVTTEERSKALLNVVTGSESGAEFGLVMRVRDLENRLDKGGAAALSDIADIKVRLDEMEIKLDEALRMQTDHPPLLYLLRFHTRRTIFWIIVVFVLLSLWYVSGFRGPILEFLGLPVF